MGFKALLQLAYFTLGPDATLNTEIHKNSVRIKAPNSVNASKRKHKNQINQQRRVLMANSTVCQSKWKPIVEPRRAKPKTYRQAPTHWLKFCEEAVIGFEARFNAYLCIEVLLSNEKKNGLVWISFCMLLQSLNPMWRFSTSKIDLNPMANFITNLSKAEVLVLLVLCVVLLLVAPGHLLYFVGLYCCVWWMLVIVDCKLVILFFFLFLFLHVYCSARLVFLLSVVGYVLRLWHLVDNILHYA